MRKEVIEYLVQEYNCKKIRPVYHVGEEGVGVECYIEYSGNGSGFWVFVGYEHEIERIMGLDQKERRA